MLERVKILLGLTTNANDALLSEIIKNTESRLWLRLGGISVTPGSLQFVVVEVSVSRYNRIQSEGTTAHSVDGVSYTWADDDFAPYEADIAGWLEQNELTKRSKVWFL